ncbi:zinc-ribbon domain-containing protein [Bremerella sp.]|uniref:TerB family tellurite resistance protein n=1 Tax=Bremerella sp. TaxID=2795602 RepID=UPI00391E0125
MIIFGTRGITSTVESNHFNCPQCRTKRDGSLKNVRTFFTLYFIPVIPMGSRGKYVECHSCGGNFAEEVWSYDPDQEHAETMQKMLRVMIMAALADEEVDRFERAEIKKQYMELTGLPVAESTLDQEIKMAVESRVSLSRFVGGMVDGLSGHGRALVLKLAYRVMSAAGELTPAQDRALDQLGDTLGIPKVQLLELIKHFQESQHEELA